MEHIEVITFSSSFPGTRFTKTSKVKMYHPYVVSNGCLNFEAKSESFSPIAIIHSTVESNCFSAVEKNENFSSTVFKTDLYCWRKAASVF